MIDEIFADIIKEARSRKGKDLVKNLATVSMEISIRLMAAIEGLRLNQRRKENDED